MLAGALREVSPCWTHPTDCPADPSPTHDTGPEISPANLPALHGGFGDGGLANATEFYCTLS